MRCFILIKFLLGYHYPPVIKHSLPENPPFSSIIFLAINDFVRGFPGQLCLLTGSYRRVSLSYIYGINAIIKHNVPLISFDSLQTQTVPPSRSWRRSKSAFGVFCWVNQLHVMQQLIPTHPTHPTTHPTRSYPAPEPKWIPGKSVGSYASSRCDENQFMPWVSLF